MVRLDGAANFVVEGIMMRCGKAWPNTLQNCDPITYRNVKILSFVPYGDGIRTLVLSLSILDPGAS